MLRLRTFWLQCCKFRMRAYAFSLRRRRHRQPLPGCAAVKRMQLQKQHKENRMPPPPSLPSSLKNSVSSADASRWQRGRKEPLPVPFSPASPLAFYFLPTACKPCHSFREPTHPHPPALTLDPFRLSVNKFQASPAGIQTTKRRPDGHCLSLRFSSVSGYFGKPTLLSEREQRQLPVGASITHPTFQHSMFSKRSP